jgi:KaiC/GvpD/RAD55 family RecA-like ATPase
MKTKVIPSGISSLDGLLGGGFPAGSLVLLLGEIGSGNREFAVTSLVMLAAMKVGRLPPPREANVTLPKEMWWVTLTRSPSDLMNEVAMSLDRDLYEPFDKRVKFADLSKDYFMTSPVPLEWVSEELAESRRAEKLASLADALAGLRMAMGGPVAKPKGAIKSLADFLSDHARGNVVFIHSLTDLARLYSDTEARQYELMLFLRGLQRAAKGWGGLVYTDLTANLFDKRMEEEIASCADSVLVFEWERAGPIQRRRSLYFKKFYGFSARPDALTRFEVNITSSTGLYVVRPEAIEGLRR